MTTPIEPIDYFDKELGEWVSPEDHEIITMLQGMTLEQLKALKADVGKDLAAHRLKILDRAIEAAETAEMAAILEEVQQELATPKQAKARQTAEEPPRLTKGIYCTKPKNWRERIKEAISPQTKTKQTKTKPVPFTTPYFHESIKETIDTQEFHNLVVKIEDMNLKELDEYLEYLEGEIAVDPAYESSHEGQIVIKTSIRAIQACEKRGKRLKAPPTKLDPWRVGEAMIHGWIVADEVKKRCRENSERRTKACTGRSE